MITNIKDLLNIKVGEVVDIKIDIEDFDHKTVTIVGTIKCKNAIECHLPCAYCVFDNAMDCANGEICSSKRRPDKEEVYFELVDKE